MDRKRVRFKVESGDLDTLLEYLKELGCVEVRTVETRDLYYRESIRRKCEYPNCGSYGNTFQCPPFTPRKELMAEVVPPSYEYGVMGVMYSPKEAVAVPEDGNIIETFANAGLWSGKINRIVGKVEAKAQELGYYKAMGFNCGPCVSCGMWTRPWYEKVMSGQDAVYCTVIRNGVCRSHRRARPSAEPAGIDIAEFIRDQGWAPDELIFPETSVKNVPQCPYYVFVLIG